MASSLVKGSAKVAICVGAVYATVNQGVWKSSSQGSMALQKVRTSVLPEANTYVEQAPKVQDINHTLMDYWNFGVEKAFNGITRAPDVVVNYSSKACQQLKDYIK